MRTAGRTRRIATESDRPVAEHAEGPLPNLPMYAETRVAKPLSEHLPDGMRRRTWLPVLNALSIDHPFAQQ